ncbi:hypothetical protein QNE60_005128, partial [Vibrio harveyi]|nr:hypothetical protein [Vibrio harveyi]
MKKILLLLCLSIAGCNDYEYAVGSGENSPPVIDAEHIDELTSIEAFTGSSTTISILASDKDGDALVYSLLDNPDWVSMDGNVLTMKPLPGDVGTYQFKIIVSDGTASTEVNVSLTIQILMA